MRKLSEVKGRDLQSGLAMMEFIVALPFLIFVILASVDMAFVLNQYLMLSHVAHAGVRAANSFPSLEIGQEYYGLSSGQNCVPVEKASDSPRVAYHALLQQRMEELVEQQWRRLKPTSLCILTERREGGSWSGHPQQDTVFVEVVARYESFFPFVPFLNDMRVSVTSSGPIL